MTEKQIEFCDVALGMYKIMQTLDAGEAKHDERVRDYIGNLAGIVVDMGFDEFADLYAMLFNAKNFLDTVPAVAGLTKGRTT